jgi:PAS domain S-box-containing protein
MWEVLSSGFSNSGFMPHGHCYLWNPSLVWTMVTTDAFIGLSYLCISVSLIYLLYRIKTKFSWIIVAFGMFIAACGAGHFFDILNLWKPLYWESAGIRMITAIASVFTAILLIRLIPLIIRAFSELRVSEDRRTKLESQSEALEKSNILREQQALKYEAILSCTTDLVLQLSNEGRIQYSNPAASEYFSVRGDSILGKFCKDLNLDLAGLKKIDESVARVMAGESQCHEELMFHKSSDPEYFDSIFTPLLDKNNMIFGISIRLRDISEKVLHYKLLEASQERFQLLVEGVLDCAIYMIDTHGRIQSWNEGAKRILGYSESEIINSPVSRFFRIEENANGVPQAFLKRAEQVDQTMGEGWRVRKDGSEFYASFVLTALRENNGDLRGFSVVTRDISQRKKTEEDLRQSHDELERRVLERTDELRLSNQQLIESRQAFIKAYAVKSDFLANMSHEIRTPLNAIIGMASVGFTEEMTAEQQDVVTTIKTAADSLLVLVNDILDFSKIEAGKVELEFSDFKLSSLCRNAIEVVSPGALNKEIAVGLSIDPHLPEDFSGDSGRILQILLNLLSNAIKFTPLKGTVSLGAKLLGVPGEMKNSDTFQVRIEICDSGIGISEESLRRLFQPFSQADSSTARKFGGTGLGLTISKRLAEVMGGKIGVESKSGEGSLFWLELPLKGATHVVAHEVPIEATEKVHSDARILVAEDNPANQKVMRRFLDRLGYKGTLVADGREAVKAFEEGTYDLIFMDCQMPEMDGYEAAQRIREIEQATHKPRTPVIALTAHAFASDRELTKKSGMDDYLSKPMSLKQLEKTINFWMDSANAGDEAVQAQVAPPLIRSEINAVKIKELEELNSDDEPDIICELAEHFFSYGEEKFQSLQNSLQSLNFKNSERDAHALKSICYNVGADNLTVLCEKIETLARNEDNSLDATMRDELVLQLRETFNAASLELKVIVSKRSGFRDKIFE